MDQLAQGSRRHPDQAQAQDYLDRVSSPADLDAVAAAEKKLRWHMERIDNKLGDSGGPWVRGGVFSLPDICLAGIDDSIQDLDRK